MKIENLKVTKEKLKFTLKDSTFAMANAIRRTMMIEVPTMAIDEIDFYENTSSMFDEYLAHRIGLIPLTTSDAYELAEDCCQGNCSKCSTMFTLDVQGPGTIYSKELKGKDDEVKPVFDNIPIIKLAEGQAIRLEAKAIAGRGKVHAKFQPCLASYTMQKSKDNVFDFEVESFGNYKKPEQILEIALQVLQDKVEELEKQIK